MSGADEVFLARVDGEKPLVSARDPEREPRGKESVGGGATKPDF